MKAFVLLVLILAFDLAAQGRGKWQTFSATAYSAEGETKSEKQTVEGRTVAADTSMLPPGTRIQISGADAYDGVYVSTT
ncbi:MAG: hypothetical protein SGI92_08855 [Bryobacteraceae bacterium]|nr:hypothetical protein [Bryobacteraceae bacterium]